MTRAQYIIEAVLSGYAEFRPEDVENFLGEVRHILHSWLRSGNHVVPLLVRRLNMLSSGKRLSVHFEVAENYSSKSTFFGAAHFSPSERMSTIYVNDSVLTNRTSYSGTPERRMFSVEDHINDLREILLHEWTHRGQFQRNAPAYSRNYNEPPTRPITNFYAGTNFKGSSLKDFRNFKKKENKLNREAGYPEYQYQVARSAYTGNANIDSWYYAQPEEIMAYAVQIGNFLTRPDINRRAALDNFKWNARIVKYYLTGPEGQETPAYNRFKKSLAEYLIKHKNMSPQEVSSLINMTLGSIKFEVV